MSALENLLSCGRQLDNLEEEVKSFSLGSRDDSAKAMTLA
jgi:hypothetical protein